MVVKQQVSHIQAGWSRLPQWSASQAYTLAGVSKLRPSGHIQPAACFCTALELAKNIVYIFKEDYVTDCMQLAKMSTTWPCLVGAL